jgi:hypothetical protein
MPSRSASSSRRLGSGSPAVGALRRVTACPCRPRPGRITLVRMAPSRSSAFLSFQLLAWLSREQRASAGGARAVMLERQVELAFADVGGNVRHSVGVNTRTGSPAGSWSHAPLPLHRRLRSRRSRRLRIASVTATPAVTTAAPACIHAGMSHIRASLPGSPDSASSGGGDSTHQPRRSRTGSARGGSCLPAMTRRSAAPFPVVTPPQPGKPGSKHCCRGADGGGSRLNPGRPVHVPLPPRSAPAGHTPAMKSCLEGGTRGSRLASGTARQVPAYQVPACNDTKAVDQRKPDLERA